MSQVLLNTLDGDTRVLRLERAPETPLTLGALRASVEFDQKIPADEQILRVGDRVFGPRADASTRLIPLDVDEARRDEGALLPSCALLLALSGGKGGFGSLLRGAAKSAGTTTNFNACRDLSGRRIGHVNAEKKLREYEARADERALEKIAMEHCNRKDLQTKRRFQEIEEEEKKRYAEVVTVALENVGDAVHDGLLAAAKNEKKERDAREANELRAREAQRARDRGIFGLGGLSDSDEDDDSDDSDEKDDDDGPGPRRNAPAGEVYIAGKGYVGREKKKALREADPSRPTTPPEDEAAAKANDDASPPAEETKKTTTTTRTTTKTTELPAEIILADYSRAKELEAFGLDRLKRELLERGLKCGGTLAERADRLFLLKDKTIDEIDPKYLPPKKKAKK